MIAFFLTSLLWSGLLFLDFILLDVDILLTFLIHRNFLVFCVLGCWLGLTWVTISASPLCGQFISRHLCFYSFPEDCRWQAPQSVIRTLLVVHDHPFFSDLSDLIQALEQICVQYLLPIGPVEAFDVGVLIGLPRLYVADLDIVLISPVYKDLAQQLRAIVAPDRFRYSTPLLKLLQSPDDPLSAGIQGDQVVESRD